MRSLASVKALVPDCWKYLASLKGKVYPEPDCCPASSSFSLITSHIMMDLFCYTDQQGCGVELGENPRHYHEPATQIAAYIEHKNKQLLCLLPAQPVILGQVYVSKSSYHPVLLAGKHLVFEILSYNSCFCVDEEPWEGWGVMWYQDLQQSHRSSHTFRQLQLIEYNLGVEGSGKISQIVPSTSDLFCQLTAFVQALHVWSPKITGISR